MMGVVNQKFMARCRAGVLLFSLAMVTACSDGTGVEPHVGFYDMTSFRGNTLPTGIVGGTIRIRSAEIELRSGSRFRLEMDRDLCQAGECTLDPVVHSGSFSISNGFITLNTDP